MKNAFYNSGYFMKEAITTIKLNLWSNLLSLFSIGLIFFILAMISSGWWVSNQVAVAIQGEAEINVYYAEQITSAEIMNLVAQFEELEGVREAKLISQSEAYDRMEAILGKEARVLEAFGGNPFSSFIEVKIQLDNMDSIVKSISNIKGIEHVRDNREVLERLKDASGILKLIGYLVVAAVGIATVVIISQIIRLGIYNNREQINTLRLLGAPEGFIALPFLLGGMVLTIGGGVLSSVLAAIALDYVYSLITAPLPFLPLPSKGLLISGMWLLLMPLSAVLGFVGSLFGLSSARATK